MIFKRWEKAESIPFPHELISFTDADIVEQRKRTIKCDETRFKRLRMEPSQADQ